MVDSSYCVVTCWRTSVVMFLPTIFRLAVVIWATISYFPLHILPFRSFNRWSIFILWHFASNAWSQAAATMRASVLILGPVLSPIPLQLFSTWRLCRQWLTVYWTISWCSRPSIPHLFVRLVSSRCVVSPYRLCMSDMFLLYAVIILLLFHFFYHDEDMILVLRLLTHSNTLLYTRHDGAATPQVVTATP